MGRWRGREEGRWGGGVQRACILIRVEGISKSEASLRSGFVQLIKKEERPSGSLYLFDLRSD